MSLNISYRKIVSALTLAVMLWNIFGWLGTGLVMNHLHEHDEGEHCDVSFCNCEVLDGNKYCTCHHPELQDKNGENTTAENHHSNSNSDFCFYSSTHPRDDNSTEALMVFAKFNALCQNQEFIFQAFKNTSLISSQSNLLLSGFKGNLLRPPRA